MTVRLTRYLLVPMLLVTASCAMDDSVIDKEETPVEGEAIPAGDLGAADHGGNSVFQGSIYGALPVSGELTNALPYHIWMADFVAGDEIAIDLTGGAGDDTVLMVYLRTELGWDLIDWNDDCAGGTWDSCLSLSIEESGEYGLLATTYRYAYRGRRVAASYALNWTCENCDVCADDAITSYVSRDPDMCARIRFMCDEGLVPIFNECGCGCGVADDEPVEACQVGGCSSHVCHEPGEPVFTTCEWRAEYACYRTDGVCERQANGSCGWTDTAELRACIDEAGNGF